MIWPKFVLAGKALDAAMRGDLVIPIEPCYMMNGREFGECLAQTEPFELVHAIGVPFEEWERSSS